MVDTLLSKLMEGLPSAEIAAELGLSESDVEAIRQSPLVRLRLQQEEDGTSG